MTSRPMDTRSPSCPAVPDLRRGRQPLADPSAAEIGVDSSPDEFVAEPKAIDIGPPRLTPEWLPALT